MWVWALTAAVLAASCGRIGYDAAAIGSVDADPGAIDADPNANDADSPVVPLGLVARYSFDSDVTSDSLGLHDATCSPCPGRETKGYAGAALDMKGGPEHLLVSDSDGAFNQSDGFTVSGWVRYRDTSTRTCLFTKHQGVNSNSWALCTDAGGIPFFFSCQACDFLSASQPVPLDTWVHIAASFDGSTKILYVDGVEANQIDGTVNFDGGDIVIGGDIDTVFGFATDGLIDELLVYDRTLSATEIATLAGQ